MKKSISIIAAATLAISMLASSALADTAKTTTDFKDLSNLEAGLKSKVDFLISNNIFEGVSSDSFGITQNMTRAQFAKVAVLIFGVPVDSTVQTSSFTDVRANDAANGWAIPFIEAAKKAGLIDGMTNTTFAPGDNVTIGQLDTVLVKGLGKTVNTTATPWYTDAVNQATSLGIHPANKTGNAFATRADLVVGAYGSWQATHFNNESSGQVSLSTVQASGDQAVLATLDKPVDTSKATLTLSKDGTTLPTTISWSADRKSATLTLPAATKLTNGSYLITLGGLDSSSILTATSTLTINTSSSPGNTNYSITGSYDLSNVIDSGITGAATGTSGYTTKAKAEDPLISKFAKEIVLKAANSSGEEIAIPGIIQSLSSSNPSIVKTAVSSDHKGFILGNKVGTATVDAIYTNLSGDMKQMSVTINVTSQPIAASSIEARKSSSTLSSTVTNGVYTGQFNAYEQMDLKVIDNYGTEYEQNEIQSYNFSLLTLFNPEDIVGNPLNGSVGTVSIDTDGTVHVIGNVTSFGLRATLPNGKQAYSNFIVRQN